MRAAAFILASTIALAGCSTASSSDPGLPTVIAPSLSPSANIVDSAIESTVARGTARISIAIDSQDDRVTGSGSIALAKSLGEIGWNNESSDESWIDLLNSDGTYTFVDDSWFLAPVGTNTPTSANISPLSQLGSLLPEGENPLKGSIALTIESGMNFSDEEIASLAKICEMELAVEIGLDPNGVISYIEKSFDCVGNEKVSVSELFDFGSPINLSTPEDAFSIDPNQ